MTQELLLDTHVFVWLLNGDKKLGRKARLAINEAAKEGGVLVPAITPWEIAMLVAKERLALDRDVGAWIDAAFRLPGIKLAPLLAEIAVASTRLPWPCHADPADRLIIATARHFDAVLVTEDAQILKYAQKRHLQAISASS